MPAATSVPITVATSVSYERVSSPTETNKSEISPPSPANSSVRADNEISFNPTIRLCLQQDLEFAAYLAMDQDKDTQVQQARLRRDMERLERRRQRQRRIEEREQEHTKILDEIAEMKSTARPDGLCNIIFVLPTETEERRIVPKTCSSEKLHLYVEAATTVDVPRLIFCGNVIEKDEKPIKDHGINRNCRVIVEETLQIEVSDTEDDDEIIHDTEPRTVNLLEIKDLTEFEQRRETVLSNLLPSVELSIRRDYILQDVLDAYTLNPNLVHHRLDVRFEGETGLDLTGVTREMFSTVLQVIMKKIFIGNAQKVPGLDHRHIFSGVYTTIGLIISHSVVLVNYFPPDISPVVFSILGCGSCSNEM